MDELTQRQTGTIRRRLYLTEEDSAGQPREKKKALRQRGFRETDVGKATHRQMMRRWRRADEVVEACRKEW